VRIDLVALSETIVERRRLQAPAGLAAVGVVWLAHGQLVLSMFCSAFRSD
jgi:hypothetical protein